MNKATPPRFGGRIKNYLFESAVKPAGNATYRFLFNSPLKKIVKNLAAKSVFFEGFLRSISLTFINFQMRKVGDLKMRYPGSDKMLFIDVSLLIKEDFKTGIQRVARSILLQLLSSPPDGYDIKVVYALKDIGYKIAQIHSEDGENLSLKSSEADEIIAVRPGDIFLGLDFACYPTIIEKNYLSQIHMAGVKVIFVVYDLLPVQFPAYFPPVSSRFHAKWLRMISQFDRVVCISETVANEYRAWIKKRHISVSKNFSIKNFHLGSDLSNSSPTKGLPSNSKDILNRLAAKTTFLLVGTIEPRKGYRQILQAFDDLWADAIDVNLVIVGKVGWNIQKLVDKISHHPELGKRLYWLQGISDEYLDKIYTASSCLVAASEGEGFGLPIIEAAQHHIPVIARDIPVFREVAGDAAYYFSEHAKTTIADQFRAWIRLNNENKHPKSSGIKFITWQQSAEQLKKAVFN